MRRRPARVGLASPAPFAKQSPGVRIIAVVVVLAALFSSAPANATTMTPLPAAGDVVDSNDGACSLREAVIAANINAASGGAVGECPAGDNDLPDLIMLASGTY